mmetsp:Transcript_7910/g.14347  ORF Transcript_7910/g.14347 Transcript_7910/m.14347 type:complete len:93 (-) Transcript_7910:2490-2768(-)
MKNRNKCTLKLENSCLELRNESVWKSSEISLIKPGELVESDVVRRNTLLNRSTKSVKDIIKDQSTVVSPESKSNLIQMRTHSEPQLSYRTTK